MIEQTKSATLLVSKSCRDVAEQTAYENLAETVAAQLEQTVIPFPIDQSQQTLTDIVGDLLRYGVTQLVTLPVFLTPTDYEDYAIDDMIAFTNRRWPFMQHHLGSPLDWSAWLELIEASLKDFSGSDTAVILATHDTEDSNRHSDVAKLARLVYEAHDFGWVDVALVNETNKTIEQAINRYQMLSAEKIIVVPYMLFNGRILQNILIQIEETHSQLQISLTPPFSYQDMFVEYLLAQHQQALADTSLLAPTREEIESEITAVLEAEARGETFQPDDIQNEYEQMKSKINSILPPRYQGRAEDVSAAPMSAADLIFDDEGAVLWDEIFGVDDPNNPYCELALAGGPSHRGELLEAVDGHLCLAEPGKYAAAVAECGRGSNMITGMNIVLSKVPGWIGVQCDSDEMAIWLLRAIIVENVMVRREGDVIYLPVGPHYTLKDQIKSIVTVTAKTWHYWIEHITFKNMMDAAKVEAFEETTQENNSSSQIDLLD